MQGHKIYDAKRQILERVLLKPYDQQHRLLRSNSTTPLLCGWPNPVNGYTLGMVIFSDQVLKKISQSTPN